METSKCEKNGYPTRNKIKIHHFSTFSSCSIFTFHIILLIKKWKNEKVKKSDDPTINKFKSDDFWYIAALEPHMF